MRTIQSLAISVVLGLILFVSGQLGLARADEPWIVYGQTSVPYNAAVDNPAANANGVIGEYAWPYTVPDGYTLVLEASAIEAYPGVANGAGMFVWLGPPPATNGKALHTVMANDATNETIGARYHLPAGTIVNLRIMNLENPAQVLGWYVSGRLVPTPPPPAGTTCP